MAISFLCSILEATLMSTPISYITMREEEGYKPASLFKQYKQDTSRPIAAILSLNTIANTIGAAGVGHQATIVFGSGWFGVVSAVMTILILVFSEIIPKTLGATRWKSLMGFATVMIKALIFLMYPLVLLIELLTKIITPEDAEEIAVSRDEVSAMANVAEEEGDLEEDENTIIQNLICMDEIKAFYKNRRFRHYSRIPVYADNDEYITGYILRMEALQYMAEDKFDVTLSDIRRDVATFDEDMSLDEIWDEMLSKDEQIAIIINEYGSFQGILTLEDVIETLLGSEIVDENDTVRDMQQLARDKWKKQVVAVTKEKSGKKS